MALTDYERRWACVVARQSFAFQGRNFVAGDIVRCIRFDVRDTNLGNAQIVGDQTKEAARSMGMAAVHVTALPVPATVGALSETPAPAGIPEGHAIPVRTKFGIAIPAFPKPEPTKAEVKQAQRARWQDRAPPRRALDLDEDF